MIESFSLSVLIDGRTYYPPGWMYIFAFTMRGIKWAMEEVEKPEFDKVVKEWLKTQYNLKLEVQINQHMQEIKFLQSQLYPKEY